MPKIMKINGNNTIIENDVILFSGEIEVFVAWYNSP